MKLKEVIEYVEQCLEGTSTSITLYNPHSWRGDYRQLEFDYRLKPSTKEELLAVLHSPVGQQFTGWKGGDYLMGLDCDVYLGSPGQGGELLTKLLLQHIVGYVFPQTSWNHWRFPYLSGDRVLLGQMGMLLLHAKDEEVLPEVWDIARRMKTKVGPYPIPIKNLGDLDDARHYYQGLCARLGEDEVENPYGEGAVL